MTTTKTMKSATILMLLLTIAVLLNLIIAAVASSSSSSGVVVDKQRENPTGPAVSRDRRYSAHVTLYIENVDDKSKTPSGWSTRKEDGADTDSPFVFQPGVNLIQGWTDGVLQMNEGERAYLHVPPALGYGARPVGSPHGPFYVPANSHLLFDIEILGREGGGEDSAAAGADEEIEL